MWFIPISISLSVTKTRKGWKITIRVNVLL